ncbi:hypothetical protein GCM10011409_20060 [Lentibacillus populi]|uniref:Uncharacterized protein n=1 Tax=Lentibacillus populi TaxID=1827502 RepID=A0A9W5X5V1_9BACI|nr:hypothetical protein [Lentibacillus populi]GGB42475.1 hypothetical protein GCM10011409_20060 [Lentibacillus populi]
MKYIEVKLSKCTAFLTHDEIQSMLREHPVIYKESLKRGKYIMRSMKQKQREVKKYENGV